MPTALSQRRIRSFLACVPILFAAGCGESPATLGPDTSLPAAVALASDDIVLMERDSVLLLAVVRDSAGTVLESHPLTWKSTKPDVAEVRSDGFVIANGIGTTRVVAAAGAVEDSISVDVKALFHSISAGTSHTCGVSTRHNAYCWGEGALGRRGDGTDVRRSSPVLVRGNHRFNNVSAGFGTTCGVAGSESFCWGNNGSGQLGRGDKGDTWTPVRVAASAPLGLVSVNSLHACGVSEAAGEALCWGADFAGQLGDGYKPSSMAPRVVAGTLEFTSVDVGMWFTCAVTAAGQTYCWGLDDSGQLGHTQVTETCYDLDGNVFPCSSVPVPVPVSDGLTVSSLATGTAHVCALTPEGVAYCWGDNRFGQLGDGTTSTARTPVLVLGGLQFEAITAGYRHTCGLTKDSAAYCWGSNAKGAIGSTGTIDNCDGQRCSATPALVAGGLRFKSLSAGRGPGGSHTCGVTQTGLAYCWGSNSVGQLGSGFFGGLSVEPVRVAGQPVEDSMSNIQP
jgi:alpha-tubulin suppressor-like RCC1 family protein